MTPAKSRIRRAGIGASVTGGRYRSEGGVGLGGLVGAIGRAREGTRGFGALSSHERTTAGRRPPRRLLLPLLVERLRSWRHTCYRQSRRVAHESAHALAPREFEVESDLGVPPTPPDPEGAGTPRLPRTDTEATPVTPPVTVWYHPLDSDGPATALGASRRQPRWNRRGGEAMRQRRWAIGGQAVVVAVPPLGTRPRRNRHRSTRLALPFAVASFVLMFASQHDAVAQQYYNSFSKMVSMTSTWQSNFYNDIIRANAARGSFRELSGASRITQQDIQNLCKPFPCGNESSLNRASSPTGQPVAAAPDRAVAPPRQYPISATDFRPVSGRIMPDDIGRMSPGNPEEKELLRTLSTHFLDLYEKEARKNNVAYSFAFLVGASLHVVTGRTLSDAEEDQLVSGFNNSIAHTPQFVSMSARDKQVLTESGIITGSMIAFLNAQGKEQNDAKMQADASELAKAVIGYFFGVQLM